MRRSILVFDEDPAILIAFKKVLQKENYGIITCSNANKVLDLIKKKDPFLVILKVKQHDSADLDLLIRLKKLFPRLPVLFMTAFTNIFNEKEAFELGADDYLKKPFEIHDMLAKVRRYSDQLVK